MDGKQSSKEIDVSHFFLEHSSALQGRGCVDVASCRISLKRQEKNLFSVGMIQRLRNGKLIEIFVVSSHVEAMKTLSSMIPLNFRQSILKLESAFTFGASLGN
ncbi:hypothetical protein HELRODRAFT_164335 [Helobdella robusta]|uniref:Uncharacterized protein n=1 Tax=Helobdella robusta TaxID=6412 RepID=T1EVA0_HELRO|nr:hypothetical protein HELRODRAFT_164335 [Helobdella robusta]ESN94482.1 hypothetical protein HELRODRAFT_164335 [Helobdella robusta]